MNVPNILTIFRFAFIPLFAGYLSTRHYVAAVIIFLAGGLTDVLDGYIARKYNMVTSWGKIADPLADKLMQLTAMVILSIVLKLVPIELIAIVLAKEIFMGIGALVLYKQFNYVVSANWYGKATTVAFYLAIVMMLFNEPFGRWTIFGVPFNLLFFILAVVMALFAFIMYIRAYTRIRQQNENEG